MCKLLRSALCMWSLMGALVFAQGALTNLHKQVSADPSGQVSTPAVADLQDSEKMNPLLRYVAHQHRANCRQNNRRC